MLVRALKWFESNLVSMVLATLLSLTVWIAATQEQNPAEQIELVARIQADTADLQPDLTITNVLSETTVVEVRAPRNVVRSLSASDLIVTADLAGLGAGSHDVPLLITINAQARVISARPSTLYVEIEEMHQRDLPIQLELNGELPIGYKGGTPLLAPTAVRISGARSRVALVSEVRVTASLSGLRETFRSLLPLRAVDSEGNEVEGITLSPAVVSVTIPVEQEEDFREVAVRVNANVLTAPGYYVSRITAEPVQVPVRGNPDILRNLSAVETQLISLQGLTEDTEIVAQLQPPEGVTLEDIQTVVVRISIQAQPDFRVIEVPIQPVELAEGLEASILPGSAVVSISGPLPVLDRLDEQRDILITVDLSDLGPGRYQLTPHAEIVSGTIPAADLQKVVIESVLPTLIEIEITAGTAGGTP